MKKQGRKVMPSFKSDEEAIKFFKSADLSEYDAAFYMRIPQNLWAEVKIRAKVEGMSYTRYIQRALEQALTRV